MTSMRRRHARPTQLAARSISLPPRAQAPLPLPLPQHQLPAPAPSPLLLPQLLALHLELHLVPLLVRLPPTARRLFRSLQTVQLVSLPLVCLQSLACCYKIARHRRSHDLALDTYALLWGTNSSIILFIPFFELLCETKEQFPVFSMEFMGLSFLLC